MTIEEALSTVRRYTNWRRGEDLRRFSEVFPECTETPDGEASWILNELAKAAAHILSVLGQEGAIQAVVRDTFDKQLSLVLDEVPQRVTQITADEIVSMLEERWKAKLDTVIAARFRELIEGYFRTFMDISVTKKSQ